MSRYIPLLLFIGIVRGQCDFNNDGQLDSLDISDGVNCILVNCYNGSQCDFNNDGYINIGAANQPNWEKLCHAINKPEFIDKKEYIDNSSRMKNINQLVDLLNQEFELKTTSEWVETLISAGVPCGPILNMDEVLNHEQIKDRETIINLNHTKLGEIQNLSFPIKFSENPQSLKLPPPLLGEHNNVILKELGYSDREINELRSESVITQSD